MCVFVPYFWHNNLDLLGATAALRGWNGYRNKSQYRKLSLGKKILPPLLPAIEQLLQKHIHG